MPRDPSIQSVLIIGSGPIVIGQAAEFDYSGTQAARALREAGIEVILINSNPATIMTDPINADHIYLWPLTVDSIEKILQRHRVDAVLPTMGGQVALNLAKEAEQRGVWDRYGVQVIGVNLEAIENTEDRELFRALMEKIGVPVAPSAIARSFLEGKEIAEELGYPLVLRPSYTLGGSGAAVVHNKKELEAALARALEFSPVHEVLVEKNLLGWKEFELELLRDADDNIAIICTIENFDPMGIHTGDSITVAPAMTLSDTAFQQMRDYAFRMMRSLGHFAGGCNVQFALNPEDESIVAIEINPRVSRSSALASKATGYPIAKVAAQLAVGYSLPELKNPVTRKTSAYFEPTLDYVIVKMPYWNFEKFEGADRTLGMQMKSVGEVMAIGRSFAEALQKACQSLEKGYTGLKGKLPPFAHPQELLQRLDPPTAERLFMIREAIDRQVPLSTVQRITGIDRWFLRQIDHIIHLDRQLMRHSLDTLPPDLLRRLKRYGFSDAYIADRLRAGEDDVYALRRRQGIRRTYKTIDTCAAEFPSPTPYFYSTFEAENEVPAPGKKKRYVVLGSGPNRIGQGIEFDYCCVHAVRAIQEAGHEAVLINCNPETVSTDFDVSDRLYFEPLFWEHVREILDHEQPAGVIVQTGGQTALRLAKKLHEHGYPIAGTSFDSLDMAEDRGRFSQLLERLGIPYPRYGVATTPEAALRLAKEIGYPVLVRPSYVLGGQGMRIVIDPEELEEWILELFSRFPNNRILIDHYLHNAIEAEVDFIYDGDDLLIMGIMEHIEPAGIHSGDSHAVLPPFSLSEKVIRQIEDFTHKIAKALNIRGLGNMQFAVKDETAYVIEANPRASRSMPFIAKAYGVPFLNIGTHVMIGNKKLKDFTIRRKPLKYAIKEPVFSFDKFPGVKKELGPEMRSIGEAIRFIDDLNDPYFRELFKRRSMYLSR